MEVLGCFLISKGLSNSHFLMKFVSRRMKREVGPSFFSSTFFFLGILAVAVDRRGPPSDQTALVSFGLPDTGGPAETGPLDPRAGGSGDTLVALPPRPEPSSPNQHGGASPRRGRRPEKKEEWATCNNKERKSSTSPLIRRTCDSTKVGKKLVAKLGPAQKGRYCSCSIRGKGDNGVK